MSKAFPTNKDHIIDEIEDTFLDKDDLSEDDYDRLREFTESQLLLIVMLLSRARRQQKKSWEE